MMFTNLDVSDEEKNAFNELEEPYIEETEISTPASNTSVEIPVSKKDRPCALENVITAPAFGTPVDTKIPKTAGPYILGNPTDFAHVKCITQYFARKVGTKECYSIKILSITENEDEESQDVRQGKMLMHAEHSLLSLLHDEPAVIHEHDFFKDTVFEQKLNDRGRYIYTGRTIKRLCLVLDNLTANELDKRSAPFISLQKYVIREKQLREVEALRIFYRILRLVERLHKRNIVHRDLKLGSFVINQYTQQIYLTNFCLGTLLINDNDKLTDQRGSPAYISPDVLCGEPYIGKPCDMWSLGVLLYTMVFGQFPFFEPSRVQLFEKIRNVEYTIPSLWNNLRERKGIENFITFPYLRSVQAENVVQYINVDVVWKVRLSNGHVSSCTSDLIKLLLRKCPDRRITASGALKLLSSVMRNVRRRIHKTPCQIVPDVDKDDDEQEEKNGINENVDDAEENIGNVKKRKFGELSDNEEKESDSNDLHNSHHLSLYKVDCSDEETGGSNNGQNSDSYPVGIDGVV